MQEPTKPSVGPRVVNIRVRGRGLTFATGVTLFALLPFLGGSAPLPPNASVVLAAGAPTQPAAVAPAVTQGPTADAPGAIDGISGAVGGGLFLFPDLAMAPGTLPALSTAVGAGSISFIRPVNGQESSPFGPRLHPVLGVPMFHTGIDFGAACGTPIMAAAAGRVVQASVSPSWGARTIIQHSPTLKTAYGHQSKMLVRQGDYVQQGQIIGLVGTTGWSTGCHLHFDVILNDRYVDPAPYLGLASSSGASVPFRATPRTVGSGVPSRVIDDGDVPITWEPTHTPSIPATTDPTTSTPTTTDPTTTDPTTSTPTTMDPTTSTPTTMDPTTSTPTTTDPTTTDPTTSTPTTTDPATTDPTTTTTTSEPAPTTNTDPTTTTTTTSTTDPTTTTSEPAPAPTTTSTTDPTTATSEPAPAEPTDTPTATP